MYCPQCKATPPKGRFCGKCGVALVAGDLPAAAPVAVAAPALVNASFIALGGCSCGAGPEKITVDGICSSCTKQRIADCEGCGAPPSEINQQGVCGVCGGPRIKMEDHDEIVLGKDLASVCDRGIKHKINQDWHGIAKIAVAGGESQILCICDGVSSSSASAEAAKAAVKAAVERASFTLSRGMSARDSISEAAKAAQKAVCSIVWTPKPIYADREDESPTCTFVMAIVNKDGHVDFGWLGDSRIYWATADGNGNLVRDHSWINQQLDAGRNELQVLDEARKYKMTRAIYRSLGSSESVDSAKLSPDFGEFELPKGGVLCVCSDGLHIYLDEAKEMAKRLMKTTGAEALTIARELIEYAKQRGGGDNVSAAVYTRN